MRLNNNMLIVIISHISKGGYAMAKINVVLEGRFKGEWVCIKKDCIEINGDVTKNRVASYEVIDESNSSKYSFWKGAMGVALLGGIGAIAGIGGKKKEYLIVIEWSDMRQHAEGTKSLICIDEKYYKAFVRSMF